MPSRCLEHGPARARPRCCCRSTSQRTRSPSTTTGTSHEHLPERLSIPGIPARNALGRAPRWTAILRAVRGRGALDPDVGRLSRTPEQSDSVDSEDDGPLSRHDARLLYDSGQLRRRRRSGRAAGSLQARAGKGDGVARMAGGRSCRGFLRWRASRVSIGSKQR